MTTSKRQVAFAGAICALTFGLTATLGQAPPEKAEKVAEPKVVEPSKEAVKGGKAAAAPAKDKAKPAPAVAAKKIAAPAKKNNQADWGEIGAEVVGAVKNLLGIEEKRAAVRMAVQIAGNAMDAQQFERQYGGRLKQIYRSELHFVRLACKPTRQQFDKVAADGEKDLKAVVKKCADMWVAWQQGRHNGVEEPDPRKLIADRLLVTVKANLSAEQAAIYKKEVELRAAARRRLVLDNLVSAIDKKLVLSSEQRTKLGEILDKNWHASWTNTQLLMQDGYYLPQLPDDKINAILTKTQKTAWNNIAKVTVYFGFELDNQQGFEVDDETWPAAEGKK